MPNYHKLQLPMTEKVGVDRKMVDQCTVDNDHLMSFHKHSEQKDWMNLRLFDECLASNHPLLVAFLLHQVDNKNVVHATD